MSPPETRRCWACSAREFGRTSSIPQEAQEESEETHFNLDNKTSVVVRLLLLLLVLLVVVVMKEDDGGGVQRTRTTDLDIVT